MTDIFEIGRRARVASSQLAICSSGTKDAALQAMAAALMENSDAILDANTADLARAQTEGLADAMVDRLTLTPARIEEMADGLRTVADLDDPIGEVLGGWKRPNGLQITKVRVPLGVIGVIYEARPNVTVDVAGLCVKSGNAAVLRGSSSALETNRVLAQVLDAAGTAAGLPPDSVQLVDATDRESAKEMMRLREYIDVLIPRGGSELIQTVVNESHVPVIETGVGNCHVYVDAQADLFKATPILINAKVQRPSVCNSAETLLVHRGICTSFLPRAIKELTDRGVEVRGDERAQSVSASVRPATEEDWRAEYLRLVIAVKVVDSIDEAIAHINKYGTRHTEAIITESVSAARKFAAEVDAACVMINASTRFADGGEFGFGAEIGISNQKLHARGPMGLAELTSYKYIVEGDGQVRA